MANLPRTRLPRKPARSQPPDSDWGAIDVDVDDWFLPPGADDDDDGGDDGDDWVFPPGVKADPGEGPRLPPPEQAGIDTGGRADPRPPRLKPRTPPPAYTPEPARGAARRRLRRA